MGQSANWFFIKTTTTSIGPIGAYSSVYIEPNKENKGEKKRKILYGHSGHANHGKGNKYAETWF